MPPCLPYSRSTPLLTPTLASSLSLRIRWLTLSPCPWRRLLKPLDRFQMVRLGTRWPETPTFEGHGGSLYCWRRPCSSLCPCLLPLVGSRRQDSSIFSPLLLRCQPDCFAEEGWWSETHCGWLYSPSPCSQGGLRQGAGRHGGSAGSPPVGVWCQVWCRGCCPFRHLPWPLCGFWLLTYSPLSTPPTPFHLSSFGVTRGSSHQREYSKVTPLAHSFFASLSTSSTPR